jgi:thiol-disulfide isomerase/thioredoxin
MVTKIHSYVLVLLIASFGATAQTISLEFPYSAGKTYEFKIVQGNKHIVLRNDTIPQDGKVQLQIPEQHKGYKGMAMWNITNTAVGGGLNMVINNEDFSVSCLDSIPTFQSIIYKNTRENTFINTNYQEQQTLFAKHDAMLSATKAYSQDDKLYAVFAKEYERAVGEYERFAQKLKNTPLYAARFREIVNLNKGIGSIITQDENLKAQDINDIIVNDMDFGVLFTSNFWGGAISNWMQLQTVVIKDDAQLIADAKTILKRMPSDLIYTEFVVSLTKSLTKVGNDNVIAELTQEVKDSDRLLNYEGVLNIYQRDLSGKVSDLVIVEHIDDENGHQHKTKTIDLAKLESPQTLVVFYQSGCGPCEETMQGLQGNYQDLTAQGLEIITISADVDEQVFKNNSAQYPWQRKYCDLKGMDGINFKNYAVIGTPTMYLIDNKGVIIQKMSGMSELLAWSKNKQISHFN